MTERERFEAWAKRPPREWNIDIAGPEEAWPGQYKIYHVECAWEAWQARCPDGYSVVPNEPTEQMLDAWFEVDRDDLPCQFVTPYKAMLSAAPQPGDDQ